MYYGLWYWLLCVQVFIATKYAKKKHRDVGNTFLDSGCWMLVFERADISGLLDY